MAEAELFPKRISEWTQEGKFIRAWYGGPKYGGGGAQTTQRIYWSNHNTSIVSDIPGEARLQPDQWGLWTIK